MTIEGGINIKSQSPEANVSGEGFLQKLRKKIGVRVFSVLMGLAALSSCEKDDSSGPKTNLPDDGVVYVDKDDHYSSDHPLLPVKIKNLDSLPFAIIFTNSFIYKIPAAADTLTHEDQYDWNKLTGLVELGSRAAKNHGQIGWRFVGGKLQICAYSSANGNLYYPEKMLGKKELTFFPEALDTAVFQWRDLVLEIPQEKIAGAQLRGYMKLKKGYYQFFCEIIDANSRSMGQREFRVKRNTEYTIKKIDGHILLFLYFGGTSEYPGPFIIPIKHPFTEKKYEIDDSTLTLPPEASRLWSKIVYRF